MGLGKIGSKCSHLCLQNSSDRLTLQNTRWGDRDSGHLRELATCQYTQTPGETQQTGESAQLVASGLHKGRGFNQPWRGQMFPELLTLQEATDPMKDPNTATLTVSLRELTSSKGPRSGLPWSPPDWVVSALISLGPGSILLAETWCHKCPVLFSQLPPLPAFFYWATIFLS